MPSTQGRERQTNSASEPTHCASEAGVIQSHARARSHSRRLVVVVTVLQRRWRQRSSSGDQHQHQSPIHLRPHTKRPQPIAMKSSVFAATLAVAAASFVAADEGGLQIVDLSQNGTSSAGTGQISAAGSLEPFGGMGLGCGINWAKDSSFGGTARCKLYRFCVGELPIIALFLMCRRTAGRHAVVRARRRLHGDERDHDRRPWPRRLLHLELEVRPPCRSVGGNRASGVLTCLRPCLLDHPTACRSTLPTTAPSRSCSRPRATSRARTRSSTA